MITIIISMSLGPAASHHHVELFLRLGQPSGVVGVNHVHNGGGVGEVVPPQGPQLFLAAHVPYGKRDVLVLHRLHIESYNEVYSLITI